MYACIHATGKTFEMCIILSKTSVIFKQGKYQKAVCQSNLTENTYEILDFLLINNYTGSLQY